MTDTVAVLADIHGVLPVLDAVLRQPEVRDAGEYLRAQSGDADAIAAFGHRDGR